MQAHTVQILAATLRADSTIAPAERNRFLKIIRGEIPALTSEHSNGHLTPRVYSRSQAAELLGGRTTRFVDLLCRKGLLKKFTAPGSQRSIGITSASLEAFISEI